MDDLSLCRTLELLDYFIRGTEEGQTTWKRLSEREAEEQFSAACGWARQNIEDRQTLPVTNEIPERFKSMIQWAETLGVPS